MKPSAPYTVVIIVPKWLQNSLAVLLDSLADFKLIGSFSSTEELLEAALPSGPDLTLLDVPRDPKLAREKLDLLKSTWPETYIIALVTQEKDCAYMVAHGADQALIKGVAPDTLIAAIKRCSRN